MRRLQTLRQRWSAVSLTISCFVAFSQIATAYPLDGYATTGIGRLEAAQRIQQGKMRGQKQPPGALLETRQVDLRLLNQPNLTLPETDPKLTAQIVKLLGKRRDIIQPNPLPPHFMPDRARGGGCSYA